MGFSRGRENQTPKGGLRRPGRRTAEERALERTREGTPGKKERIEKRTAASNKRRGGKSRAMMNNAGKSKDRTRPFTRETLRLGVCMLIARPSF